MRNNQHNQSKEINERWLEGLRLTENYHRKLFIRKEKVNENV